MLVFRKENLVFLAVPKTGTTALEGALAPRASIVVREPAELKHAPFFRFQRFILPFLNLVGVENPEICAVVRHPVDWLGSWYRYRNRDEIVGQPNSTRGVTFDAFVNEYCRGKPAAFADVGSQARFMTDLEGNSGVQHLFRYEAQDRLLSFLRARLGDFPEPNILNVSPYADTNISAKTLEKLQRKRSEEFAVWEAAAH